MFFKRTPAAGKQIHIIIFTRGRASAYMGREREKRNGKRMEKEHRNGEKTQKWKRRGS